MQKIILIKPDYRSRRRKYSLSTSTVKWNPLITLIFTFEILQKQVPVKGIVVMFYRNTLVQNPVLMGNNR